MCGTAEAEFLDEIQTKVLSVFLLPIQNHLYIFALRFLFLETHATSYNFYSALWWTLERRKEVNMIENHTPFPMIEEIHTETLRLRNIKEIVRSWIRLLEKSSGN